MKASIAYSHTCRTANEVVPNKERSQIFSGSQPILVTVDPISTTILRIELVACRTAESWKRQWRCLHDQGYYQIYVTCDQGAVVNRAHKQQLPDTVLQPDTYHAIAHRLGHWVIRLEKAACKAIELEQERYNKLDSAKSDAVIEKRIDQYEQAHMKVTKKIRLYEDFHFLYGCLTENLKVFDTNGKLRKRECAEANMQVAIELIKSLDHGKINDAIKNVERILPELLNYFDVEKAVVGQLAGLAINQNALNALCAAYQWRKDAIKSKNWKTTRFCSEQERFILSIAEGYLQQDFNNTKALVYEKLDTIIQSSSIVECINSIIRPYLNASRNHITQEYLNLIMFYHNHRRYKDGKRKGKTPMEILSGREQEKDWMDLLFDYIEQKDPKFFS